MKIKLGIEFKNKKHNFQIFKSFFHKRFYFIGVYSKQLLSLILYCIENNCTQSNYFEKISEVKRLGIKANNLHTIYLQTEKLDKTVYLTFFCNKYLCLSSTILIQLHSTLNILVLSLPSLSYLT